jgi:UDP-glucuronate 4-epimerase
MQAGDVHETYADIDAIRDELGYRPATSIEVGVPRFVDWYRNYCGIG